MEGRCPLDGGRGRKGFEYMKCKAKTEVFSRVVGYYRPIQQWNRGKQEEYFQRKAFRLTVDAAPVCEEKVVLKDASTATALAI